MPFLLLTTIVSNLETYQQRPNILTIFVQLIFKMYYKDSSGEFNISSISLSGHFPIVNE